MTDPMTPKTAQDALAEIERAQLQARRRAIWPRWARYLEAAALGLCVVVAAHPTLFLVFLAIVGAGIAFRYWSLRRVGATQRWHWTDTAGCAVLTVALVTVKLGAFAMPGWAPIVIGLATALAFVALYEAQRYAAFAKGEGGSVS